MREEQIIGFKSTSVRVVRVLLGSADWQLVAEKLQNIMADTADFFAGEQAILDFTNILDDDIPVLNWSQWISLFQKAGLRLIACVGWPDDRREELQQAGLGAVDESHLTHIRPVASTPLPTAVDAGAETPPTAAALPDSTPEPVVETAPAAVQVAPAPPALPEQSLPPMMVHESVRSGQQCYARNRDLMVMERVNAGAEVIADGCVHVFSPLRGRAIAGATGDESAYIFTTSFEAELVSVAGIYRAIEQSELSKDIYKQPVLVYLEAEGDSRRIVLKSFPRKEHAL